MKSFKPRYAIFAGLFVIFLTNSCRRDFELAPWDADVLAPISHGVLNLGDLLIADEVVADSNGLFHLRVSDTLISLGLDSLIGIPDTAITESYFIPIGFPFPTGTPFYSNTTDTKYKLKDVELTYAEVRTSSFTVKLTNNLKSQIIANYRVLSATLDGDTFELQEFVPAKSTVTKTFNLDGYSLNLRGLDGTSVNSLATQVEVMVDPAEGSTYNFSAGEGFSIENSFEKIIPQYAVGYFGSTNTVYEDETSLDIFEMIPFDALDIAEFDVRMTIDNGVGADLKMKILEMSTSNSLGESASLSHSIIGQTQQLSRAVNLYNAENPVKHIFKTFDFTHLNSNLDELVELRPNKLRYNLDLSINPLGNISLGNDFVYYGNDISVLLDMDVPLKVGVSGLVLQDTFDLEFVEENPDQGTGLINSGYLRVYFDNAYPFSTEVQLYLQDENGLEIDSLLPQAQTIASATADAQGEVLARGKSEIVIPVNQAIIEQLKLAKALRLRAVIDSYDGQVVNLYENYTIGFKMVADLNVNTQ